MATKKLVRVDKRARTHVYEAARTDRDTKQQLVTDLVDRAFGGSAAALVVQALSLGVGGELLVSPVIR